MPRILETMKGLTIVDMMDLLIKTYFGFAVYIEAEKRNGNLDSVVATIKFANGGSKRIHLVNVSKETGENPFEDLIKDKNHLTADRNETYRKLPKPDVKPGTTSGGSSKIPDDKAMLQSAANDKAGEKTDDKFHLSS